MWRSPHKGLRHRHTCNPDKSGTAREAVRLTERALERARLAATQSTEVVRITDVAFREGATTNIEVIDAQRRGRDAETTAAIAEDAVRRARLELLVAVGRVPR